MAGPWEKFGDTEQDGPWSQFAEVTPEKPSAIRRLGDAGISVAKGIIGVPEAAVGIADLVTGGQAGKLAESAGFRPKEAKAILSEYYSPQQKAANAEVDQAQGFFPTVGAMLQNPSTIVNSALESAPSMIGGGAISRGLLKVAPRIGAIGAGAAGEGFVAAGQNAEQVRQEDANGLLTGTQSAILAASGMLTGGLSLASGKLSNKLGIGDIQTQLAAGKLGTIGAEAGAKAASKGLIRKTAEGFATEGITQELPQSYQEQVAQNIAQGKPWDEGASKAGAQGMMAGGLMGSGGAVAGHFGEKPMGALEAAASLAPKSIPLTEEGAQKRADTQSTAEGKPYEVVPSTVAGRFTTQEVSQPLTEALNAATSDNNVDTPAPSANTGGTGLDDSLRNDNTGGSAVAARQEAAPRQNGALAAVDGTGDAGTQGRTEAVNPIQSAYELRESTKPRIQDTDILDSGKPFATPFSAAKVANELGDGYKPFKLPEGNFVVRKADDAQSAQAKAVETGAVAGTTAEKPAAADTTPRAGVVEANGVKSYTEKFHGKVPEVTRISADKLEPKNTIEMSGARSAQEGSGLSPEAWAKTIDLSEPIQASVFSDGGVQVQDGHHRMLAAKILGKPLNVDLQAINAKPEAINGLIAESTTLSSQPKEINGTQAAKAVQTTQKGQAQPTTGQVNANPLQAPNGDAADPNNLPATAVSAVTGDRRLPADRLEPALQPEPKMVQGVPEAVQSLGEEVSRDIGTFKQGRSESNAKQTAIDLGKKNPALDYSVEADDTLKNGYVVVGRERVTPIAPLALDKTTVSPKVGVDTQALPKVATDLIADKATNTPASGTIAAEMSKATAKVARDDRIDQLTKEDERSKTAREDKIKELIASGASPARVQIGVKRKPAAQGGGETKQYEWQLPTRNGAYIQLNEGEVASINNAKIDTKPTPPGLAKMQAAKAVKDAASNTPEAIARQIQTTVADNRRAAQEKSRLANTAKGYAANTTPESEQASYDKEVAEPVLAGNIATAKAILDKDVPALIQRFVNGNFEASEKAFHKITGVKINGLSAANKKAALYKWADFTPEQMAAQEKAISDKQEARSAKFKDDEAKANVKSAWGDLGRMTVKQPNGDTITGQAFIQDMVAKGFDEVHSTKKGVAVLYGLKNDKTFQPMKHKNFTAFLKAARDFGGLKQALGTLAPSNETAKQADGDIAKDFAPPKENDAKGNKYFNAEYLRTAGLSPSLKAQYDKTQTTRATNDIQKMAETRAKLGHPAPATMPTAEQWIATPANKRGELFNAPKSRTTEPASHQDPGQKPEAATTPVIAESLQKAQEWSKTRNGGKPSDMKANLLAQIDAAFKETADYADYQKAVADRGQDVADTIFIKSASSAGYTATEGKGQITFDVPGDGKFKIQNTLRGLYEFRVKVEKSPGFKDTASGKYKFIRKEPGEKGSASIEAALANMLEERDFEAAMAYREATGTSLNDVKISPEARADLKAYLKEGTTPIVFSPAKDWKIQPSEYGSNDGTATHGARRTWEQDGHTYMARVYGNKDGARYSMQDNGAILVKDESARSFIEAMQAAEEAPERIATEQVAADKQRAIDEQKQAEGAKEAAKLLLQHTKGTGVFYDLRGVQNVKNRIAIMSALEGKPAYTYKESKAPSHLDIGQAFHKASKIERHQPNDVVDAVFQAWLKEVTTDKTAQEDVRVRREAQAKEAERQPTEHEGVKIYPTTFKSEPYWSVQIERNRGTDRMFGDTLHKTLEDAKKEATLQARNVKDLAERQTAAAQEQAAAQAKKDANKGKSIVERRNDAVLDKRTTLHPNAGLGNGTRREAMQKAVEQERLIKVVMVEDNAAKKRDQEFVDRNRNLPTGNVNYPGVKEYFEAKDRLQANNYEKPDYHVYMGRSDRDSFYNISKTEFDYAQKLKEDVIAQSEAKPQEAATAAPVVAKDTPAFSRKTIDVQNQTESEAFKRWSNDAPLITSAAATTHEFKTGEKVVLEAFHGAGRPDRIGGVFKRSRATSGPMAYHTSDPELASNYAKGKPDTSLALEDNPYQNWFKYKPQGQRTAVSIDRAWYALTPEQKATIAERMPDIRQDDDANIIYEKGGGDIGSYEWNLKQTQRGFDKRGNPLAAAVETWLNSGAIFGNEQEFMQVLKLAGFPIKEVNFDHPHETFPSVYKNYIEMQNPLVVSDIPQRVVDALDAAAKTDRSRAQKVGADTWDKNTRTLKEWVATFHEKNNEYVWTSIPDKVTEVFESLGFDGIIDKSGKGGGAQHPVYIPFKDVQIKSAIGNRGTFDAGKKDINYSRRANPQTDTPAFKAWFGDSKVVDEQGKPLVVYHGGREFNTFDIAAPAARASKSSYFWFTSSKENAEYYQDGEVKSVYVALKNPAIIEGDDPKYAGMTPREIADTVTIDNFENDSEYDGVIVRDVVDGVVSSDIYIVFPNEDGTTTQVKSATGNNGNFDASNPDIRFSQGSAATGLPTTQVQSITDSLKAKWANAPEIIVAANMDDKAIQQAVRDHNNGQLSQGAEGSPEGFLYGGKVYLVADQLNTPTDVMRVLFHETLGHVGLRGVFGKELTPILQQIAMFRPAETMQRAINEGDEPKNLPKNYTVKQFMDALPMDKKLKAAEEVLAYLAQTKPELGFVKRAVAAIRTWLKAHGVNLELSDNDIIANYILPARAWVQSGKASNFDGATAFSRLDNFKAWFANSRVKDMTGQPAMVYHGTNSDFSVFDKLKLGTQTAHHATSKLGFFFTSNAEKAGSFATGDGANVMAVKLKIENPYQMTVTEAGQITTEDMARAKREDLQKQGYDGIRIANGGIWVAFEANQIKSATGNNGEYGKGDDIRFSRGINDTVTNKKDAPATSTSTFYNGQRPNGMQERQTVRAVTGSSAEPAQLGSVAGSSVNPTTKFRVVDIFGDGARVQYFDDRKGLFYESQNRAGTMWVAGEVVDGREQWLSGNYFKTMEDAIKSVRSQRAVNTRKANFAAKYGDIPNTWKGEAKKVAMAVIDAGHGVDRFSSSTQTSSKYLYLDNDTKIRLADHDLPGSYEQADYDFRYGEDIPEFVAGIQNEPTAPDSGGAPMFSRTGDVVETLRSANTLRQATNSVKDMLHSDRTFNMWERTISTQFQKASKSAPFKRVFEAYNNQTDDIAHYAIEAERLAPSVLQRLDGIKDTFKAVLNSGAKYQADIQAIAKPLLANIEGVKGVKQVKYDAQSLKQIFNLTDRQIEMYQQVRLSVDTSLERLAQTYAAQMGADQGIPMDSMRDMGLQETVDLVKEYVAQADTEQSAALLKRLDDMVAQTTYLQDNAYMPAMRFGNFAVTMKDGDTVEHFAMYDSQLKANLAAGKLKRENPNLKVSQSLMNEDRFKMFKGVSPETVELFAQFTGMDSNEAYQDYIALAKSGRSSAKRLLEREGVAGFNEDITRILASFVSSNARQSAMNMNQSEITAAMSAKDLHGDVQNEAQKLNAYMSDPQEEAHRLRGFLFLHFIGGSVASAAVNLTQPILQTAPYLSQFAGAKTAKIMAAAARMAATGNITPNLKEAMARAKAEGITDPHEIHNLMADASGATMGGGLRTRALVKAWGSLFSISEAYNRRLTFLASYQTGLDMGQEKLKAAGFKDVYDFAKHAIIETQGLYSKTNRPNWARGAVGATLFTFKQFSISYVEFLSRLPNKQKAIALGMLVLAAGLQGLPGADDLEDLIDTIGQSLGYNTNSKRALRQTAVDLLGEDLGLLLTHGMSSMTNVDLQGRLGMGNLIPGTGLFKMSEKDKTRSATEFAGALGGVLNSAMDAIAKAQKGEIWGKTGALATMSPVTIRNFLQGAEAMQTGVYTDTRGRKVQDIDGTAAFLKMFGFQPGDIAQESRKMSELMQTKGMMNAVSGAISDKWAESVATGDKQGVADALATLQAWNKNNPESRIILNPSAIRQKILAFKMTREQRFLKTLPKTMRAQAMEELG